MPILDTHISGEQLRMPSRVDAGKPFRQIGAVAQKVGEIDQKREVLNAKISLAEQKNILDSSTINAKNDLALHQEQFTTNPFGMSEEDYYSGQREIVDGYSESMQPETQSAFQQNVSSTVRTDGIKARASYAGAVDKQGKQNTLSLYDTWAKDQSRNPFNLGKIGDEAVMAGYYDADQIRDFNSKAIMGASLNDANSNPHGTLQALEGSHQLYDLLDDTQKKKVKAAAISTIAQNKKLAEIRNGELGAEVLKQVDFGGVPSDFYGNVLEAETTGVIDKAEAASMRLAYQRGRGVDQKTSDETFTKLSLENSIVDTRTEDKYMDDSLTYSKQVRDLYKNIYTAYGKKELTFTHFQKLLNDAGKSTAVKSEAVKKQLLDPLQAGGEAGGTGMVSGAKQPDTGYVANQGAFDSFMLYTGNDIARSNNLMTKYISDKSEVADDEMSKLLPTIIYEDKKRRAEKTTTLAIRLLTTKEKGKKAESAATAFRRETIKQDKEKIINGITYTKTAGGWKRK